MLLKSAVYVWIIFCSVLTVSAGEGPSDQLRQDMIAFKKSYNSARESGRLDDNMKKLMKDLRAASRKKDWPAVSAVIEKAAANAGILPADPGAAASEATALTAAGAGDGIHMQKAVAYESSGVMVKLLLWAPDGAEKKYPAIIVAHDGFNSVDIKTRKFCERLARAGYIVAAPQFRGQGGSGGRVEWAGGEVADLLGAIAYVKELESFHAGRLGLVAEGHGGVTALLALAQNEDVKRAIVIGAPCRMDTYLEHSVITGALRQMKLPWSLTDAEAVRARSPLFTARQIKTSLRLMAGRRNKFVTETDLEGLARVILGDEAGDTKTARVTVQVVSGVMKGLLTGHTPTQLEIVNDFNTALAVKKKKPQTRNRGGRNNRNSGRLQR